MTMGERYLSATQSSNLRTEADRTTDADKLLAAAYAVAGDPRRDLALRVWRLKAGDMRGCNQVADDMGQMMQSAMMRKHGGYLRKLQYGGMSAIEARDLSLMVLKWWAYPTCPACHGRKGPLIPGTPVLDESMRCSPCGGTGQVPLERLFKAAQVDAAKWLVSELEGLSAVIFGDMARILAPRMDLNLTKD
jgi:hypothetical protein